MQYLSRQNHQHVLIDTLHSKHTQSLTKLVIVSGSFCRENCFLMTLFMKTTGWSQSQPTSNWLPSQRKLAWLYLARIESSSSS